MSEIDQSGPLGWLAPVGYSRAAACRFVGLSHTELEAWESAIGKEGRQRLPAVLSAADLVALAVIREVSWQLGARAEAFTFGLSQLFEVLGARPDVETLDSYAALVGPDFARLAELRSAHVRCPSKDFAVVPLRTIMEDLRDEVFLDRDVRPVI